MNDTHKFGNGRTATIDDLTWIAAQSVNSKNEPSAKLAVIALAGWFDRGPGQICFQALDPSRGYWRHWDGQRWALYEDAIFARDLRWLTAGQWLAPSLNTIIDTLKTEFAISPARFNQRKIVVFENKTMHIKEGKIGTCEPSRPEDYVTIKLPLTVPSTAEPTPVWDSVIKTLLPNEDDRKCLQEMIGYCLFSTCKKQVFFCLVGEGGTGKTTVLRILGDMMGDGPNGVVTAVPLSILHKDHVTASLIGSLLNVDSEAENMESTAEAVLKNISGNGVVHINPKYKPGFNVEIPTKIVLACNNMPRFSDKSAALWQQLVLIPFDTEVAKTVSRTEEIDNLIAKVRPEYSGITLWALAGLRRVLATGKSRSAAFSQSPRAKELLSEHRRWSDPFEAWWEDKIEVKEGAAIRKDIAYEEHCLYRTQGNHNAISRATFCKLMAGQLRRVLGAEPTSSRPRGQGSNRSRCYTGIGWRAEEPIEDTLGSIFEAKSP